MKLKRTELIFHLAAVLALAAAILMRTRETPSGAAPPAPSVTAVQGPVPGGEGEASYAQVLSLGFTSRLAEIPGIKDTRERYTAYLILADEAYRVSTDAARTVLRALVEDPEMKASAWKGQELLLLGAHFMDVTPESRRLTALCHEEALRELVSGPGYEWAGAPSNFGSFRDHARSCYEWHDPEGAKQFLVEHPEVLKGGHFTTAGDRRVLIPFLEGALAASEKLSDPSRLYGILSEAGNAPPEMQTRIAARIASLDLPKGEIRAVSRFYAEADSGTREALKQNASPRVRQLIHEEELIEKGEVPELQVLSSTDILHRQFRTVPLTAGQTAALLTEGVARGEFTPDSSHLRSVFSQIMDPKAVIAALPAGTNSAGLASALYGNWAARDPVGMSSLLATGDLPQSDLGIQELIASQRSDPEAQLLWAQRIGDPGLRQKILPPLLKRHAAALPGLVEQISTTLPSGQ